MRVFLGSFVLTTFVTTGHSCTFEIYGYGVAASYTATVALDAWHYLVVMEGEWKLLLAYVNVNNCTVY